MSKKLDTLPLFNQSEAETKSKTNGNGKNATIDSNAEILWNKCLTIIRDNVSAQVYKTWFEPIKALRWTDNQLLVQVPSQFFCEWIEEHFYPLLQKTTSEVLGDNASLKYHIVVDDNTETLDKRAIQVPAFKYPPRGNQNSLPFQQSAVLDAEFPSNLNPRYTFENFVRGDCNQLATSAAMAVSQNPGGTRFNPLVIYGDTGLGKTHLIQAIGNHIAQKNRNARTLYTTSERFTMEFVNAIQNNRTNEFINFYRSIDVLIVDDIQFFGGKEKTQDNFFHTFNALHQAGKQLILSSDKPPKELADVDERLISRFQWGLVVDIQPPDLEMRMAILQKKSQDEGIILPADIVEYLAKHITNSVRELEGSLINLTAKVTFDQREMNLELAKEVVHGVGSSEPKPLNMDDIKELVSKYYNQPIDVLESKSRKHEVALARQMAMYLAKQLTPMSLKSIGSHFGNRDHSTVLHSCQTIENYLITDKSVKIAFETLLNKLKMDR